MIYVDTSFDNNRGSWVYCDDSRITQADAKEVVVGVTPSPKWNTF